MANKVFKGVKSTLLPDTYVNSPESVAPLFSASTAYTKGDQVYNGLKLYRFTANHAAGAWTGSDVEEVTVGGQLKTLNEDTTELKQEFNKKVSIITKEGKNRVDPTKVSEGKFLLDTGVMADLASYATCDFIPIKAQESMTFSPKIRSVLLYNSEKEPISSTYENISAYTAHTVTPNADGYVRASFYMSDKGLWQAEYGSSATNYEPYQNNLLVFQDGIYLSDAMRFESKLLQTGSKLSVAKAGTLIRVQTDDGFARDYYVPQPSKNKNFCFVTATLNGVVIKDCSDDITPQRIGVNNSSWTVGGNHGWACYRLLSSTLTQEDVGSVWTDGTRQFTLASVNNTEAVFLYPCTKTDGKYYFDATAPVGTLTHVSGATHTTDVSLTSGAVTQIYPSTNHEEIRVVIGGETITEDGEYKCGELYVVEHYEIMDYISMNDYLKSHIGASLEDVKDNIESVLALDYVYHIFPHGEVVYSCATAIGDIHLSNSGFMQATAITENGNTVYRYVNGVKDTAYFASDELVNMTDYNTDKLILKTDLSNPSKPTNRCVDVAKNNGNIQYGFAFGFIPDIGDGSDAKRSALDVSYMWDMRSSKKSYPTCVANKDLGEGESVNVVGYRYFITANQTETNRTVVPVGDKKYVFIDLHEQGSGSVNIDDYGNDVTVIDHSSMNISDVVGANGITFNTSDNYSYAVLKVE